MAWKCKQVEKQNEKQRNISWSRQTKTKLDTLAISLKTIIKYTGKLFLHLYPELSTNHQQTRENILSDTVYQYLLTKADWFLWLLPSLKMFPFPILIKQWAFYT